MLETDSTLFTDIRNRFANVEACPISGRRIYFENAGGALTLNSVIETSRFYAGIPDNQSRDNAASLQLMQVIDRARTDMATFLNASSGHFLVGESGTELLFRLIRNAIAGSGDGTVLGSTVEHPATRSAAQHWSGLLGQCYESVTHDDASGMVAPEAYAAKATPRTKVATVLHTSPVTGMRMDLRGIVTVIRKAAPEALIIVDGIQHACHGQIDIDSYDIDGYVISPYKVFSRHGYGIAWVSERLTALPHERLTGSPVQTWEIGTRDTGAYATMSDVVTYFDWLGGKVSDARDRRGRIKAAGRAIHEHEHLLTDAALHGVDNLPGLAEMPGITVLGGIDNPAREGLVSYRVENLPASEIVAALNSEGVRTHVRKSDHYSGNILAPLGIDSCVRVSFCHYNSRAEVAHFLSVMQNLVKTARPPRNQAPIELRYT